MRWEKDACSNADTVGQSLCLAIAVDVAGIELAEWQVVDKFCHCPPLPSFIDLSWE